MVKGKKRQIVHINIYKVTTQVGTKGQRSKRIGTEAQRHRGTEAQRHKVKLVKEQAQRKMKTFRDLQVWQKSMTLVTEIYKISKEFPKDEAGRQNVCLAV